MSSPIHCSEESCSGWVDFVYIGSYGLLVGVGAPIGTSYLPMPPRKLAAKDVELQLTPQDLRKLPVEPPFVGALLPFAPTICGVSA